MDQKTIDLINDLLQDEIDSFIPTERYLAHQLGLPANERITDDEQEEIERKLKNVRFNLMNLANAHSNFKLHIHLLKIEGK